MQVQHFVYLHVYHIYVPVPYLLSEFIPPLQYQNWLSVQNYITLLGVGVGSGGRGLGGAASVFT